MHSNPEEKGKFDEICDDPFTIESVLSEAYRRGNKLVTSHKNHIKLSHPSHTVCGIHAEGQDSREGFFPVVISKNNFGELKG